MIVFQTAHKTLKLAWKETSIILSECRWFYVLVRLDFYIAYLYGREYNHL